MVEKRNAYNALAGANLKKKNIPFGRPKRRWEDNIKVYLNEIR